MTNAEYVTHLIKSIDRIYIDTSALMNTDELELLVNNIQDLLHIEGKRIIVPQAVYIELLRHLEGYDDRKRNIALKVFEILSTYEPVFFVQNSDFDNSDFRKTFADAKLLAELTEKKTYCKQLLITNDRKLGHDAYDLNNLESCKGHIIKVCYLNRFGELHRCDCVKAMKAEPIVPESEIEIKEVVKVVTVKNDSKTNAWNSKTFVPVAALLLGIVVGKYSEDVWHYIKKVA